MYRILYNDRTIFDPYGDDDEVVTDAVMDSGENASTYLDFTMSVKHPLYNVIAERDGTVRLYWDSALLFEGVIESIQTDIELNKTVSCIGPMDYLNDSVVRPYSTIDGAEALTAPSSVEGLFQWLIDQHNEHVLDQSKSFSVGVNQGASLKKSSYIYASSNAYPTTASEIENQIIDAYGGYLFVRYENGLRILDLYADIHEMNAQIIDFGVNITDFSKTLDTKDQYTALIPQGGSPTFQNGDLENGYDHWVIHDGAVITSDAAHAGSSAFYVTSGSATHVNDSFFYLKPGYRYKATAWVRNDRTASVTIHLCYQINTDGSWKDSSDVGTLDIPVKDANSEESQWTEFTLDFLPTPSVENAKIRPKWYFTWFSNDSDRRVYLDDFDFTRLDGEDNVSEDPIDLTLIPDGPTTVDSDVAKQGDAIYSVSNSLRYGYKETTYSNDSLTTADDLLEQSAIELRKQMAPKLTIEVKAVDLSLYMEGYEHLQVGQAVRVRSVPHDVDEYLMVSSIDLDLQNPGQTEYVFGASYDSLTGQQSGYLKSLSVGINSSLDSVASLDQSVKDQAVQIGSVEQIANDAKDTADNAQNTANSAQQAAQDAQNSASSALDKAEAVEGAVNEIQGMIDDINSGAEQAKQDAAQAKADAQQAAAKADAASQAAQAAANKADALEGSITDVTTTVNGVVQDIEEITTSVTGAISTANEALSAASSASQDLEGFKTTVSQTYQLKGDYATNTDLDEAIAEEVLNRNSAIEQSASSITSTVSQTYATKTDLAVTDGKAAQAQSAAQQAQTSASNAQSTANAANNTANGVADDLTDYMETVATTYASKSELEQTSESITATVEANYTEVKQLANTAQSTADSALSKANEASGELADFTESVTSDLSDLQSQIDGNIATWFYAGTPTLTNEPAVNWTTTEEKNQHLGDLYYDTNNGYAWRFMVQNGSYSWGRITDSDVTKALEDAANAQDTADSKRRVFVTTPKPPYDVGDLWVQGSGGDIKRCQTAKTSSQSYAAADWVLASKYTDDSALDDYKDVVATTYATKSSLTQTANEIRAEVSESYQVKGDYATSDDLDDAIAQEVLDRNSAISQSATQIQQTVSQTYTTKAEASAIEDKADAAQSTANTANSTANSTKNDLNAYKTTVSTTYATKSEVTQTANSIKQEVAAEYTTKEDAQATYATKTEVEQTAESITQTVSETYQPKGDYVTDAEASSTYATKSSVTQTADSIKSEVAATYTTKTEFEGLEVGGRNLIPYTMNAYSSDEWSAWFTPTANIGNSCGLSGSFTFPEGTKIGDTFTLSLEFEWTKFTAGTGGTFKYPYIQFYWNDSWSTGIPSIFDSYFIRPDTSVAAGSGVFSNTGTITAQSQIDGKVCYNFRTDYSDGTGKIRARRLKLEKGNKATDWTPAPEDITTSISETNSVINQTREQILMSVESTYYTKSEATTLLEQINTQFTQTSEDFTFTFNQIQESISNLEGELASSTTDISKYIRFIDGEIWLGKVVEEGEEDFKVVISNERIRFLQNNVEVAYISNKKLYITQAEIVSDLQIGLFTFVPRNNGNLTLRYLG